MISGAISALTFSDTVIDLIMVCAADLMLARVLHCMNYLVNLCCAWMCYGWRRSQSITHLPAGLRHSGILILGKAE